MKGTTKAVLIGGAAALGVPALANALIYSRRGQLSSPLLGERNIYRWKHGDIVYYTAGQGEPLILVHGVSIGNSSYEWRKNFPALARNFTVFALDMLGFGESDKPAVHYDARLFVDLLTDFVIDVVDAPTDIIASTHGAAFSIEAARKHKILIRKLVLVCPTGIDQLAEPPSLGSRALSSTLSVPVFGTSMYYSIASRDNISQTLKRDIFYDPSLVTEEMIDYYYTASHQPGAERPAKAFLSGQMNVNVKDAFSKIDQPTLIVWGRQARMTPVEHANAFLEANPKAKLKIVDDAGAIPHFEQPDLFNSLVTDWLQHEEPEREEILERVEHAEE